MLIVLAGGSGLIGTALADGLRTDGHRVRRLVRGASGSSGSSDTSDSGVSGDTASWDPAAGRLDPAALADADAVVCLSGAGVGDRRWTDAYKAQLRSSRLDTLGTIARTMAAAGGPSVLLAASAVGYYGDTGDRPTGEDAPAGDTFLAQLCVDWEAAAEPARAAGVRVAHLRTGLVVSRHGGLLPRLRLIVKAGIGGRLGSGRQYWPWISLDDEIRAIEHLLTADVAGPVNLSAPEPVTNAEFTRTLGRVLHRPTPFVVPAFAARVALGEFATEVLIGQRALPRRLVDSGFAFADTDLDAHLHRELGQ